VIRATGSVFRYPDIGYYKDIYFNSSTALTPTGNTYWNQMINDEIINVDWIDNETLVFIMSLNLVNPNTQLALTAKLIFQMGVAQVITLEYDAIVINCMLYNYKS
jgi:hypothetical protein